MNAKVKFHDLLQAFQLRCRDLYEADNDESRKIAQIYVDEARTEILEAFADTQWHERREDGGIDEPKDGDMIIYETIDGDYGLGTYLLELEAVSDNGGPCIKLYEMQSWCYLPKRSEE